MRRCTRLLAAMAVVVAAAASPTAASAESYEPITGEGSTWAGVAIDAMRVNVKQFGLTVNYGQTGSTAGRKNFLKGIADFAGSDIPFQFQPEDGSAPDTPAPGSYAYMPITAGGTAFMYNLKINGQRVTNLRLSGENVAKIFASVITQWNDPALVADNPGLALPDRKIVPIVRPDGSGSTAQFSLWMIKQHGGIWNEYCQRSGRAPKCGQTSFYPTVSGMIGASGDPGVAGRVAQPNAEGAIGYINYSYALGARFPVAKVLNKAGYYTEPTPDNVAVSLLKSQINTDPGSPDYLTQNLDGVYSDPDERNYQLSSYSYLILPTTVRGQFNVEKGKSLSAFSYSAMCQARAVGLPRVLADAHQPREGGLRADPQDPRRGGSGHRDLPLQEPDVLPRWHQPRGDQRQEARRLRPQGAHPMRHRDRRPEAGADQGQDRHCGCWGRAGWVRTRVGSDRR